MDYSSKTCTNMLIQQKHREFKRNHSLDTLVRNYHGFLMVVIWSLCLPHCSFACQNDSKLDHISLSSSDFNPPRYRLVSIKKSRHCITALAFSTEQSVSITSCHREVENPAQGLQQWRDLIFNCLPLPPNLSPSAACSKYSLCLHLQGIMKQMYF